MRLGVDRHEGLRAADGHRLGAEGREQVAEQVAGDRALLVDRDPQAGEGVGREGVPVALPVALDRPPLLGAGEAADGAPVSATALSADRMALSSALVISPSAR